MPRLAALVLVLAVLTLVTAALAADPAAPPPPGLLPPTAPMADFNQPAQSSWSLITAMHVRGPEKFIGAAVVILLLIALVMFAGMLRHVYGGRARAPPPRPRPRPAAHPSPPSHRPPPRPPPRRAPPPARATLPRPHALPGRCPVSPAT